MFMKILEILDTTQQFFKAKKPFADDIASREESRKSMKSDELSGNSRYQGSYGSVRLHKKDPHLVRKRGIKPRALLASDGYYAFITDLVEYYKRNGPNPYLPRIYNIHHVEDSKGRKIYTADIERLFELDSLNMKELEALFSRVFNQEYRRTQAPEEDQMADILKIMIDAMKKAVEHGDFEYHYYPNRPLVISDEQLIKALKFIKSVANEGYWLDIRAPNIMIRRTPYGAQLVFTDPIGD
jgi:hypothetical protein